MSTIDVVLVTWPNHPKRMEYLRHTWGRIQDFMSASNDTLRFVCSSESERDESCDWCGDDLEKFCCDNGISLVWRDGPASLGAGMNAAMRSATSDVYLVHQDDFELQYPLDLSPGASLLRSRRDIDIIRYGYPPQEFGWKLTPYAGDWKRFDMKSPWPYGDEPHMQRQDFTARHGWYQEHGGHASEGAMLWQLVRDDAVILAADKRYYDHMGTVSAVPAHKECMSGRVSKREQKQ